MEVEDLLFSGCREPTRAMIVAGEHARYGLGQSGQTEDIWVAMWDAMIAEKSRDKRDRSLPHNGRD